MKWKVTLVAMLLAAVTFAAGAAQAMCVHNGKEYSPGAIVIVGTNTLECQKDGTWRKI